MNHHDSVGADDGGADVLSTFEHDGSLAESRFLDRELSWLEFNARVLHEAFDERNPLLERLKFLAIFSTNIDEFFMVRVAGLRREVARGGRGSLSARATLEGLLERTAELASSQRTCLHDLLLPRLAEHDVRIVDVDELTAAEWERLDDKFEQEILPALSAVPLERREALSDLPNLALAVVVRLRDPRTRELSLSWVKVPRYVTRWAPVPGRRRVFVPLERVIAAGSGALFPGLEVLGSNTFRVIRWSEEDPDAGDAADPLSGVEERVFRKRFAEAVRLEVEDGTPREVRERLREAFDAALDPEVPRLEEEDVVECGPLLALGDLFAISALDIAELHDAPFVAPIPAEFFKDGGAPLFDRIKTRDLMVHHPFQSFAGTVEQFVEMAAADESVTAIKMTLYRSSGSTRIVRALTEAAQRGKEVVTIVELEARFDEAKNIAWARALERAGAHVTHGPRGLKTHAKLALVVRSEDGRERTYVHLGTGNYNARTARVYTDIGLFTCNALIGADVNALFETVTGENDAPAFESLLVAPFNLRAKLLELIANETARGKAGKIVAKMNALVDGEVIESLYAASAAGVETDLIVRGTCRLRPGVGGLSERIRVVSVVGRFLEHSRVWCFGSGDDRRYYIGSADWMERNLDRRVEVITPVRDPGLMTQLGSLLTTYMSDNRGAWDLRSDGSYVQRLPGTAEERSSQAELMRHPWGRAAEA